MAHNIQVRQLDSIGLRRPAMFSIKYKGMSKLIEQTMSISQYDCMGPDNPPMLLLQKAQETPHSRKFSIKFFNGYLKIFFLHTGNE